MMIMIIMIVIICDNDHVGLWIIIDYMMCNHSSSNNDDDDDEYEGWRESSSQNFLAAMNSVFSAREPN
jgi:hypothetical protein